MKSIRALSIRQPWAHAILALGKDIENRGWATSYRGPLLIHAGKKMAGDDIEALRRKLSKRAASRLPDTLPRGGFVGLVDLIDCVEDHKSPWFNGPYGFVLANPRPLPFLNWKGNLGLMTIAVADLPHPYRALI